MRDWIPNNSNFLTPYIAVQDAQKALDFYLAAFGFETAESAPDKDGELMHVGMLYCGKKIVMFAPESVWQGMKSPATSGVEPPISFYVYCEDVAELAKQAEQAGAVVKCKPMDTFWGDRMVRLQDIDHYVWTFATKVGEFDESKMPRTTAGEKLPRP